MKRLINIIKILFVLIGALFGLVYWHTHEQKAWFAWKQHQLNIVEEVSKKQREMHLTNQEASLYAKTLTDSLYVEKPSQCIYCFVKSIIK